MGFLAGAVPECSVDCSVSSVFELSSQYAITLYHFRFLSCVLILLKMSLLNGKLAFRRVPSTFSASPVIISIICTSRTAVP